MIENRGGGGVCWGVAHGVYYSLYVQESLGCGGGSSRSISVVAASFGSFPLSGIKLTFLFV